MNWGARMSWSGYFVLPFGFLLVALNAFSDTDNLRTLLRTFDAVIIPGKVLDGATGRDISSLRLLSLRNGTISSIPFQIDQRDEDGQWVWDLLSGAKRTHDDEDPEGRQVFDDNDMLVLIARDIGDRLTNPSLLEGSDFISEITITDPVDGTSGWVYLAHFPQSPPELSTRRYVNYDKQKNTITAENYEFILSDKYLAVMDTLRLNGKSILDRTKVRGQVELSVFFIKTTIEFNEEEIGGYNEGYINGPVRLVKRSVNHLVMEGMDAPDVMCDHFFYPQYSELPIAITMQFPVDKVKLRVTGDYFGGQFERVYAEGLEKPVDLSELVPEGTLLKSAKESHWMALDSKSGSIVLSIKAPESISPHLLINPWLVSDPAARYAPESILGASPEIGFEIETGEDFPSGEYVLHAIYKFSSEAYQPRDARNIDNLLHRALQYRAAELNHLSTQE